MRSTQQEQDSFVLSCFNSIQLSCHRVNIKMFHPTINKIKCIKCTQTNAEYFILARMKDQIDLWRRKAGLGDIETKEKDQ